MAHQQPGIGVDAQGGAVIDPTKNVLNLVEREIKRLDDMSDLRAQLVDEKIMRMDQVATLRAEHAKEIRESESNRLNAIRQEDVLNASTAAERAGEAIRTLATQTAANQEANRNAVTASASALASQLTSLFAESNKRLSAVELALSAGAGKGAGLAQGWIVLLGAIGAIGGLLGIAGILYAVLKP
jgi:hypothetical protein